MPLGSTEQNYEDMIIERGWVIEKDEGLKDDDLWVIHVKSKTNGQKLVAQGSSRLNALKSAFISIAHARSA